MIHGAGDAIVQLNGIITATAHHHVSIEHAQWAEYTVDGVHRGWSTQWAEYTEGGVHS